MNKSYSKYKYISKYISLFVFISILITVGYLILKNYLKQDSLSKSVNTFTVSQAATFTLDIKAGKITNNFKVKEAEASTEEVHLNEWSDSSTSIKAYLTTTSDPTKKIDLEISKKSATTFELTAVIDNKTLTPGEYQISANITQDGKDRNISQNFLWGVLAINPNKSVYLPGETSFLSMAVLDEKGEMVCDAQATLEITDPEGKVTTLSTQDGSIIINDVCKVHGPTSKPDYESAYITAGVGKYLLSFSATTKNGNYQILDFFEVKDQPAFEVERVSPTRVYPPSTYTNTLNIVFHEDFSGEIADYIPSGFQINPIQEQYYSFDTKLKAEISNDNSGLQTVRWQITAKKGDKLSIGYTFKTPNISPQFYLMGPLTFKEGNNIIFEEIRRWQIANDAANDVIVLWDVGLGGTAAPSGWSCISCNPGEAFYGYMPRGASGYGTTGGTDSHNHAITYSSATQGATDDTTKGNAGASAAQDTHTHTWGNIATVGSGSVLPPYKNLEFIYKANPTTLPNNAIIVLDTGTIPSGMTRYSSLDNNYLRGYSNAATGGSATHNHSTSAVTSGSSGTQIADSGAGSSVALDHTHTLSASNSPNADNTPPYVEVVFAYNSSGSDLTLPNGMIAFFDATPPTNWSSVSGSSPYSGNFLKGATGFGTTGGSGATHNHTSSMVLTSGTPSSTATNRGSTGTYNGAGQAHTHDVTYSIDSKDSLPQYKEVILGKYTAPTGLTISGNVYGTDESTYIGNPPCDGTTNVVSLKINGTGSSTTDCDISTGYYEFTGLSVSPGDTATVYLNGSSTPKANLVLVLGASNSTNAHLLQNRIVMRDDNNGTITNEEASDWDNDNDSTNMLFYANTNNMSTDDNTELHIYTSDTYDPGGTVTTSSTGGTFHIDDSGNAYFDTSTNDIGSSVTVDTGATWYVDTDTIARGSLTITGTLNKSTGTPTLTTRGTGSISGGGTVTLYNLTVGDATTATTTLSSTASATNNVTVGTGSTLNINAGLTVTGNLTNTTTGIINTTAGTPTVTMNNATSSTIGGGSGAITFYALATSGTGTHTFSGSGTNTINNNVTVGTGTTLNINSSVSIGGNLTNTTTGVIGYSSGTPTITMTNNTSSSIGGGSGAITFYDLATSGSGTHSFSGSGTNTINNNVSVGTGTTLNINSNVSIAGNLVNTTTGIIGYSGTPTVTLTGTSNSVGGGSGAISFYNLTVDPATTGTITLNSSASVANTLNVASGDVLSLAASQNLTLGTASTLTLSGTVSGSGLLIYQSTNNFPTTGTLSSPLRYDSTSNNQDVVQRTYGGNVELYTNSASAARTITLGTAVSQTLDFDGNLTLNAANTQSLTVTGATNSPNLTLVGNLTSTAGGGVENLTTGAGTWTINGNVDLTNIGTLTVNTGNTIKMDGSSKTLTSASETLYNFESAGTISLNDALSLTNNLTISAGTFTQGYTTSVTNDASVADGATYNVNANLDISGGDFTTALGATVTTTSGTPTVNITGTGTLGGGTNAMTFYNLTEDGVSTLTPNSPITVNNTLTIGDGTNAATFQDNTNDKAVSTLDLEVKVSGIYSASSNTAAPLTVSRNFTNNGTFNANVGKIVFDTTNTSILSYAATTTFGDFSATTPGKHLQFDSTDGVVTDIDGALTLTGNSCTTGRIFLEPDIAAAGWNIAASGATSISYVDVQYSIAAPTLTASNSTEDSNNNTGWTISGGVCGGGGAVETKLKSGVKLRGGVKIK